MLGILAIAFLTLGVALFAGAYLKGRAPWYRGKRGPRRRRDLME